MDLDIGAKRPVNGDQVFLVGRCFSSAEPAFVLMHDPSKRRRSRRNLVKVAPETVISDLGAQHFVALEAPQRGTVWFRRSGVRDIRALQAHQLATSPAGFGALVLFEHDPEPLDEHAGFCLYGITAEQAARSLGQAAQA